MSKKAIKARNGFAGLGAGRRQMVYHRGPSFKESEPVFVLPATREAYLWMVERMACVIDGARLGLKNPQKSKHFCGNDALCASEALAAIGILQPKS